MKNQILLITMALGILHSAHSQDYITKKNGDKIDCKITNVDSTNVYFDFKVKGNNVSTYIAKDSISNFQAERNFAKSSNTDDFSDTIKSENKGMGNLYYLNGKLLTIDDLTNTLKSNQEAFEKFKNAKSSSAVASVFAFAGGFMIGYPIGTLIRGGEPQWALAGIGAGFLVVMIPIAQSAEKQAKEAIDIYNGTLKKASRIKKDVSIGFSNNGIGLFMRF